MTVVGLATPATAAVVCEQNASCNCQCAGLFSHKLNTCMERRMSVVTKTMPVASIAAVVYEHAQAEGASCAC